MCHLDTGEGETDKNEMVAQRREARNYTSATGIPGQADKTSHGWGHYVRVRGRQEGSSSGRDSLSALWSHRELHKIILKQDRVQMRKLGGRAGIPATDTMPAVFPSIIRQDTYPEMPVTVMSDYCACKNVTASYKLGYQSGIGRASFEDLQEKVRMGHKGDVHSRGIYAQTFSLSFLENNDLWEESKTDNRR